MASDIRRVRPNGNEIRRLRENNGLSQEQLAQECKKRGQRQRMSKRTIERVEHGQPCRPSTIAAIGDALGMDPPYTNLIIPQISESGGGDDRTSSGEMEIHFADLIAYHCAAFAGRMEELAAIKKSLSDRDGAYVFVEGPSGYGKTALLARLTELYPDAAFHFFNQSLRGSTVLFDPNRETCFLNNLCGQIVCKTTSGRRTTEADLRAMYLALLAEPPSEEKRRIIIIDAIDEVDSAHNFLKGLFPHKLAPCTFVVFSARTIGDRNYLRHVGLTDSDITLTITLDRFDLIGIEALLKKAGGKAVRWSKNEQFVAALLTATNGDPFYLRFLAEDVRTGRIGPENISEAPKGLYDYLDSQFELLSRSAQRQQQRDILGYILTAKGPLSRTVLISRVEGLDHINFEATIQGIRRFLLEHSGEFTFCHERFRRYFLDKAGMSA